VADKPNERGGHSQISSVLGCLDYFRCMRVKRQKCPLSPGEDRREPLANCRGGGRRSARRSDEVPVGARPGSGSRPPPSQAAVAERRPSTSDADDSKEGATDGWCSACGAVPDGTTPEYSRSAASGACRRLYVKKLRP
jgi:hypothetical protein